MIRTVQTEIITETIKKMCIEANYSLSSDMVKAMRKAEEKEESVLGKQILAQLQDNLEIAASDMILQITRTCRSARIQEWQLCFLR